MKTTSILACILVLTLLTGCATTTSQPEPVAEEQPLVLEPETPTTEPPSEQEQPLASAVEVPPVAETCPEPICPVQSCPKLTCPTVSRDARLLTDKLYLGQVESISIKGVDHAVDARIDTGATTTSIDAKDIERFERDGKSWIRFTIPARADQHEDIIIERPRKRRVLIKGEGQDKERRYVVELYLTIDGQGGWTEVSLTDRSAYEYQLLLGRNFLTGRAVVDVSLKHHQGSKR